VTPPIGKILTALPLVALQVLAGCAAPEPTLFDQAAAAKIHHLAVFPMQSSEPSISAIASGLATVYLTDARLGDLTVAEAPALWRLHGDRTTFSPHSAVAAGRESGADAVLTGVAQYSPPTSEGSSAFAAVTVQIISVESGTPLYINSGKAFAEKIPDAFIKAFETSLQAFEMYLQKSRKKT
jgi:hypothetical protein